MMGDWTFFSNHGHVFFCLARDGAARLRDVAADVGLTERAVQKIVKDLQQDGYVEVRKQGRCNRYRINRRKFLRHPLEAHCSVSKLVNLVIPGSRAAALAAADAGPALEEAGPQDAQAVATASADAPQARTPAEPVVEPVVDEPAADEPAADEPAAEEPAAEQPAVERAEQPAVERAEQDAGKPRKRGKRGKSRPVDVRKQGSLF